MGFLVRLFLALVIAISLGATTAWFSLDNVAETDFAPNGAWRVPPDIRDHKLGLYERAALAKANLLAPDRREAINLYAYSDEAGEPLSAACTYRIESINLPARAWSVSAYRGRLLAANEQTQGVVGGADGGTVRVSAAQQQGAWLPVEGKKEFTLALHLYGPDPSAFATPASFAAPRIIRESCQ